MATEVDCPIVSHTSRFMMGRQSLQRPELRAYIPNHLARVPDTAG